jgi:hypothetical protein
MDRDVHGAAEHGTVNLFGKECLVSHFRHGNVLDFVPARRDLPQGNGVAGLL